MLTYAAMATALYRVCLLSIIVLAALLASEPGNASSSDARADARFYSNAHDAHVVRYVDGADQLAGARIEESFRACRPTLGTITPTVDDRLFYARGFFRYVLKKKLLAPYYLRFYHVVAARPIHYAVFGRIVADIKLVANDEAKKLEHANFNWCSYLQTFRARGWTLKFMRNLIPYVLSKAGVSWAQLGQIDEIASREQSALQKLGLSSGDAVNVTSIVLL